MRYSTMIRSALSGFLILLFSVSHASCIWWNADSIARSIPSAVTHSPEEFAVYLKAQFPDEISRVKALYSWISSSIVYDPDKSDVSGRFESIGDFVLFTLRNRQAVCQGYAEVFTAVCARMGIPALTVHGYTRVDGELRTDIGHAWNIAKVEGKWRLFDPTWGSGYLDDGRYRKCFSYFFFMPAPDSLIVTHMPFDPIWQLLDFPITHDQFVEGGKVGKVYIDYADSLDIYYLSDEIRRAESTLGRAKATHADRKETFKIYRKYYNFVINMKCNEEITHYNDASSTLQIAIDRFNEFRELSNQRHQDKEKILLALNSAAELVQKARIHAQSISSCQSLPPHEIRRLIQYISDLEMAVSISYREFK